MCYRASELGIYHNIVAKAIRGFKTLKVSSDIFVCNNASMNNFDSSQPGLKALSLYSLLFCFPLLFR